MDKKIENSEPNYFEMNKKLKGAENEKGKRLTVKTKTGELSGTIIDSKGASGSVTIDTGRKDADGHDIHAIVQSTEGQGATSNRRPGRFVHVEVYSVASDGTTKGLEQKNSDDLLDLSID